MSIEKKNHKRIFKELLINCKQALKTNPVEVPISCIALF